MKHHACNPNYLRQRQEDHEFEDQSYQALNLKTKIQNKRVGGMVQMVEG
jgi:hypothetical protein